MNKLQISAQLIFCCLLSTATFASDAVLEINQACAINGGCFSGDTAGYPITIDGSAGRSYLLTSDLITPDENTTGIEVNTPSISVDLNGFEIVRSGCEGATTDCTSKSGNGHGVHVTNSNHRGVSVKNGSITGMGQMGVLLLGIQAEAKGLRVRWNASRGISTFTGATVSDNIAYGNGLQGIFVFMGSTVSGNTSLENGNAGIYADQGSTVSGNTSFSNEGDGIFAESGSTVSGNTSSSNGGDGIFARNGCLDLHNTVRGNTGVGLNLAGDAAYRENVITGNTDGTVSGGVNAGGNVCNDRR